MAEVLSPVNLESKNQLGELALSGQAEVEQLQAEFAKQWPERLGQISLETVSASQQNRLIKQAKVSLALELDPTPSPKRLIDITGLVYREVVAQLDRLGRFDVLRPHQAALTKILVDRALQAGHRDPDQILSAIPVNPLRVAERLNEVNQFALAEQIIWRVHYQTVKNLLTKRPFTNLELSQRLDLDLEQIDRLVDEISATNWPDIVVGEHLTAGQEGRLYRQTVVEELLNKHGPLHPVEIESQTGYSLSSIYDYLRNLGRDELIRSPVKPIGLSEQVITRQARLDEIRQFLAAHPDLDDAQPVYQAFTNSGVNQETIRKDLHKLGYAHLINSSARKKSRSLEQITQYLDNWEGPGRPTVADLAAHAQRTRKTIEDHLTEHPELARQVNWLERKINPRELEQFLSDNPQVSDLSQIEDHFGLSGRNQRQTLRRQLKRLGRQDLIADPLKQHQANLERLRQLLANNPGRRFRPSELNQIFELSLSQKTWYDYLAQLRQPTEVSSADQLTLILLHQTIEQWPSEQRLSKQGLSQKTDIPRGKITRFLYNYPHLLASFESRQSECG